MIFPGLPAYANVLIYVLAALFLVGSGGAIVAWRKDWRQAPADRTALRAAEVNLSEAVRKLASDSVADATALMEAQDLRHQTEVQRLIDQHRSETAQLREELMRKISSDRDILMRRIRELEQVLTDQRMTVPPWPEAEQFS